MNSAVCLIGYDCKTNQNLSTIFGVTLLCYAIDKFTLAVEHWIDELQEVANGLKYVHDLMIPAKNFKKPSQTKRANSYRSRYY